MKKLYNRVKKAFTLPKKHKAKGQPQLLHSILKPALQKNLDYKGAKERFKEKIKSFKIKRLRIARPIGKIFSQKHKAVAKAHDKPSHSMGQLILQEKSSAPDSQDTSVKKERFKAIKEKIRGFKTKTADLKKGISKSGFKKLLKGNFKNSNPKKNKIIDSKRLAFLLTAGTIIAILPTFNLGAFPALTVASACIFSINFIAVKTLKKFIKQRKLVEKSTEVSKKLEDVSVESVQKEKPKQND